MYEKRRDWEKLIAVNQREIDKLKDGDVEVRKARRIELAKLASEKMKKASVSIDLWQKVLADDTENVEALGGSRSCSSARSCGTSWARCWSARWRPPTDATRKSAI